MGLGVTQPQGVLLNIKQNISGSNVISASNLNRELLTLAYDGSMGLGVTQPQGVLLNIKQNISGSNVISASNLNRELLTSSLFASAQKTILIKCGKLLDTKSGTILEKQYILIKGNTVVSVGSNEVSADSTIDLSGY